MHSCCIQYSLSRSLTGLNEHAALELGTGKDLCGSLLSFAPAVVYAQCSPLLLLFRHVKQAGFQHLRSSCRPMSFVSIGNAQNLPRILLDAIVLLLAQTCIGRSAKPCAPSTAWRRNPAMTG